MIRFVLSAVVLAGVASTRSRDGGNKVEFNGPGGVIAAGDFRRVPNRLACDVAAVRAALP